MSFSLLGQEKGHLWSLQEFALFGSVYLLFAVVVKQINQQVGTKSLALFYSKQDWRGLLLLSVLHFPCGANGHDNTCPPSLGGTSRLGEICEIILMRSIYYTQREEFFVL